MGSSERFDRRRQIGSLAEDVACAYLSGQGMEVVGRNVRLGRGEIDLVVRDGGRLVAVEVRSRWRNDPLDAFDGAKQGQVEALAGAAGCSRVDLVAIRFAPEGIELRWVPGVS